MSLGAVVPLHVEIMIPSFGAKESCHRRWDPPYARVHSQGLALPRILPVLTTKSGIPESHQPQKIWDVGYPSGGSPGCQKMRFFVKVHKIGAIG